MPDKSALTPRERFIAALERRPVAGRVFAGYRRLLRLRRGEPAFHPNGGQQVLELGPAIFAVVRTPPGEGRPILCLVNVSPRPQRVHLGRDIGDLHTGGAWHDLIEDVMHVVKNDAATVGLAAYQVRWLAPRDRW